MKTNLKIYWSTLFLSTAGCTLNSKDHVWSKRKYFLHFFVTLRKNVVPFNVASLILRRFVILIFLNFFKVLPLALQITNIAGNVMVSMFSNLCFEKWFFRFRVWMFQMSFFQIQFFGKITEFLSSPDHLQSNFWAFHVFFNGNYQKS